MNHYFIKIDYQPEFGISGDEVIRRLQENRIPSNALVRNVESKEWKSLTDYPEFLYLTPPPLPPEKRQEPCGIINPKAENSKLSLPQYLLPKGRVNGSVWFFRNLIYLFLFYCLAGVFSFLPDILNVFVILPIFAYIYIVIINASKRLHDWNITGWLAPIVFIPFVGLLFWLIPGNRGPNRYGEKLNGVWRYLFNE